MIDEKKQIEEMAVAMCGNYYKGDCVGGECTCTYECIYAIMANRLYRYHNYRKQSEGEWVANPHISISKRGRTIHYATYKCSVCGKWNGRKKQKYCPNCGAKMKGE